MAKTITAMLVGIAIEQGRIRSIDDHPDAYVPELAGTEYGRTPLRDLLTMSSGVKFIENYSGYDDAAILVSNTFQGDGPGGPAAVVGFKQRLRRPGTQFYYASAETQVLGLVLRAAVGRPLADYLSDRIWKPMGAEADASWLIDDTIVSLSSVGKAVTALCALRLVAPPISASCPRPTACWWWSRTWCRASCASCASPGSSPGTRADLGPRPLAPPQKRPPRSRSGPERISMARGASAGWSPRAGWVRTSRARNAPPMPSWSSRIT
jgi:hypothetical protein